MSARAKRRTEDLSLLADTRELSKARAALRVFMEPLALDDLDKDSLLLAFDEAVTNAITYGPNVNGLRPCGPLVKGEKPVVRIRLSSGERDIEISVTDQGPGCDGDFSEDCDPLTTSGRGILLMNRLVDEVLFERSADCGTTVKLVKRF